MFIEILQYLETAAATVVAITNDCALIRHIYTPFIRKTYLKRYANIARVVDGVAIRNKTNHILLVGGGVKPEPAAEPS